MKKFFKVFLFLGIFIGLGKSGMLPVHAQMQAHTYELTEEERYNPKYYKPLSEQGTLFGRVYCQCIQESGGGNFSYTV